MASKERTYCQVVVVGNQGTGKSSLITAVATDSFPKRVPVVLPPTRLPHNFYPDRVSLVIIDTSSRGGETLLGTFVECKFRTTMWGWRLVQLQKRFIPVLSNSFAMSLQCSSTPDVREFMEKGLTAIAEVDWLSRYTDFNDIRLRPLLKTAKESLSLLWRLRRTIRQPCYGWPACTSITIF